LEADDQGMTKTNPMSAVSRTVVAVVTSILTGASAGVVLARKPLVADYDRRRRMTSPG